MSSPTPAMPNPLPGQVSAGDVVRRLSRDELDRTLLDLLGDSSGPAARYLAEDEHTPFDNDTSRQQASSALIESIEAMATEVGRNSLLDPTRRASLIPCTPAGVADAACFRQVVKSLGQRAFRRPLSDAEADRYLPLLSLVQNEGASVGASFDTAIELVVRSLLQDPEFLYRVEVGTPGPNGAALTDFEIASRLSYLLWGTMPDETLFGAAAQQQLTSPAGRQGEAVRLLSDERAKRQWYRFHAMWLGYRSLPHPADLTRALAMETEHLIDRVLFENASYLELFQSNQTYVDATLATHYGIAAPPGNGGWVTYADGSQRAGILSHGSVLSGFSKFSDTSPTQRGIFVRTRLMCDDIPPPPPIVDVDQPPMSTVSNCKIDRYAAHRETPSCAACHEGIDLIGVGLEQFDRAGRFRTHDDGHPECTIQAQGTVPMLGTFTGPKELSEKLVTAERVQGCMVAHFFAFAKGRPRLATDAAQVLPLQTGFKQKNYSFQDLLLTFVGSEEFALKKEAL